MKKNIYITLFSVMVVFALVLSLTLSTYNYINTKKLTINHENDILIENINQLIYAIDTNEKVLFHLGKNISEQMHKTSISLNELYNQTKSFESWDFDSLSEQYNMDIYIINSDMVIEYSNLRNEVGLNFKKCCSSLATILDQRRLTGEFYHDGLEAEQFSGEIKKYSYMSTADHNYLIQLGLYLKNVEVYNQFDFDDVADELINERLTSIRLLNVGGRALGTAHANYELSEDNKVAYREALETNQTVINEGLATKSSYTYMYIPITSKYDMSYTNRKVIEIIHNKSLLNEQLTRLVNLFILQIAFILIVTVILSILIAKKFSLPIFLAFHDAHTKLGNRAYLTEYVNGLLLKQTPFSLILFDIDNFKMVNDRYGHAIGDEVIKQIAGLLTEHSRSNGYSFRLGGDEFVTILLTTDQNIVTQKVKKISSKFKKHISPLYPNKSHPLTLSIGIAYATKNGNNLDEIVKAADEALYAAKKAGKDQYVIFEKDVALM